MITEVQDDTQEITRSVISNPNPKLDSNRTPILPQNLHLNPSSQHLQIETLPQYMSVKNRKRSALS